MQIFIFTVCCLSKKVSHPQHSQGLSNRHNSLLLSDNIADVLYLSKQNYSDSLAHESESVALPPPFIQLHGPDTFLALTLVLIRQFHKQSNSLTWQNTRSFLLCSFFTRLVNRIMQCLPLGLVRMMHKETARSAQLGYDIEEKQKIWQQGAGYWIDLSYCVNLHPRNPAMAECSCL